jgi:hypothetical protein
VERKTHREPWTGERSVKVRRRRARGGGRGGAGMAEGGAAAHKDRAQAATLSSQPSLTYPSRPHGLPHTPCATQERAALAQAQVAPFLAGAPLPDRSGPKGQLLAEVQEHVARLGQARGARAALRFVRWEGACGAAVLHRIAYAVRALAASAKAYLGRLRPGAAAH